MAYLSRILPIALLGSTLAYAQKPALVQNIDEKGRVPYQQFYAESCAGYSTFCSITIPVPAGQRLVVTHINGFLSMNSAQAAYGIFNSGTSLPTTAAYPAQNDATLFLPLTDVGQTPTTSHGFSFDRELTLYADGVNSASMSLAFAVPVGTPASGAYEYALVVGYLIPLPAGATN